MPTPKAKRSSKTRAATTRGTTLALELLREPKHAIRHAALLRIRALRPGKAVIVADLHSPFEPLVHAHDGTRATWTATDVLSPEPVYALGEKLGERHRTYTVGSMRIRWESHELEVFEVGHPSEYGSPVRHRFIVADSELVAARYFSAVSEYASEVRDEVLVFANGCWNKNARLFESIQKATWDDSVLGGDLAERLRTDFDCFLAARSDFESWRIPWKRGALFVGPPGNGKTMAIRTLLRHLALPCLYVQSFAAPRGTPEQDSIEKVFERARRTAPCVMVLEDLDSLVTPSTRSFFLNALDGFAENHGLITIASTNHPETLDPAIVDRPSRFDRKYHFDLPGEPERRRYALAWNRRLPAGLALDDTALDGLASATDEFSFAYMKELFAASLMRIAAARADRALLLDALREEVNALRSQMKTSNIVPVVSGVHVPQTERGRFW